MVVITTRNRSGNDVYQRTFSSDLADPTDSVEISKLSSIFPHNFLGIQMFSDAAGTVPIIDSTGVFTIAVKTLASNQYEAPPEATIDATDPITVDWAALNGTVRVTVTTPLTDTVKWQVVLQSVRT